MINKSTEERIYERLNLPIKVNYEVFTRPHDTRKGTAKNIGGGGICLPLQEKLLPDTKLKIDINVPMPAPESKKPFSVIKKTRPERYAIKGRVVWVRRMEVTGDGIVSSYYDTGIEFQDSDPVIVGKIVSYFYDRHA